MKAVICTKYGPPEVLQLQEVAKPVPKDNEVLIKIHTTTVTSGDCRIRSFTVPPAFWFAGRLALGITKPRNAILGSSLVGDVEAVGSAVTKFKIGDVVIAVAGQHNLGAYAEYICMSENSVILCKPETVSDAEAAAMPFGGMTAMYFLQEGQIQPGQQVLINGASGAVGTFAVQFAKHFGAEVTGVCSGANIELVKSLGADRVIDYTKEDFTQNGQTYDIIFDTVGNTNLSQCRNAIKENGVYLHAVMVMAGIKSWWYKRTTGIKVVGGTFSDNAEYRLSLLRPLLELVEQGKIKPVIDRTYPLEEIVEAHRYVDTGRKKGNVVITVVDN